MSIYKKKNYVKNVFLCFFEEKNIEKLEFMLNVINSLKKNKEEVNINLPRYEIKIFNFKTIGYKMNKKDNLIEYLLSILNKKTGVFIFYERFRFTNV